MSNPNQEEGPSGLKAGTVVDGRYKVVRCIGQGGNGLIHEVEHVRTGRKLAMKSLLQDGGLPATGRLEQEARATSLIMNAHASRITDMGTSKETGAYLVMELLDGQSLRALLDEAGQLPLELVVNIALQVCECLDEAHRIGIIHRDLKPENIFLCASPWPGQYDVRVLDFGVVKIASDGPIPNSSLTRTGSTVGTPYYMSLEQLRNASTVDARADVYALGVVMYESLSGKKPFMADTIGDLVYALCSGPATHIGRLRPDLPAEIGEIVMRSLSATKEERPKSMADFAAALLPHGNAAFGLWVRVDGKQPALARKVQVVSRNAVPTPSAANKMDLAAPIAAPIKPPPPPPIAAGAPAIAAPAVGPSAWTDAALGGGPTAKPAIAAPTTDPPPTTNKRRDTPTEMFGKSKDDEDDDDAPEQSGDRDTPTRAITAAMIEEQRQKRAAASGTVPMIGGASIVDDPTGMLPPRPPAQSPSLHTTAQLDVGFMATLPAAPIRGMAAPMFGAPAAPPPPSPRVSSAQLAPVDDPFKPGWQKSLDGVLVSLGGVVDRSLAKYRGAPRNTQVLVLISAGSVGAFLIVLILFVFIR